MADAFANFAYSTVLTAPSPAASGTSLVVQSGDGAKFPATPFNAVVWPAGAQPTTTNAEIVRVTSRSTDTLTITRTQESTSARTIVVGDQIAASITNKFFTDLATDLAAKQPLDADLTTYAGIAPGALGQAILPMTTLTSKGLVLGRGASALAALAPDAGTTKFLKNSVASDDPTWQAIAQADVSGLTTASTPTFAGLTLTAALTVANGGTGLAALTARNLLIGNGTSAAVLLAPHATTGMPLISQGASADPVYGAIPLATAGVVSGTLPAARGGTSNTTYAVGDMLYASGTTTLSKLVAGTAGMFLKQGSGPVAPAWASIAESDITSLVADLALKAPLASPTFTGTPLSTTPSAGDNSTKVATTAYVDGSALSMYGDGSDGALAFDGTSAVTGCSLASTVYTLTRDLYASSITLSGTVTQIKTANYRIFVNGTLAANVDCIISNDGAAASGATGGLLLATGTLYISTSGGDAVANGTGNAGTAISPSIGGSGGDGGALTGSPSVGGGAAGGVATAPTTVRGGLPHHAISAFLGGSFGGGATTFNSYTGGAGGAAGNMSATGTGSAGAGGAGGAIVDLFALNITVASTKTLTLRANGGAGSNATSGTAAQMGGGGGGGGGAVLLVYATQTITGTLTLTAAGGAGGTKLGTTARDGATGSSGTTRQIQV